MVVGLNEIDRVVEALKKCIDGKDSVVLLQGDLSSGKTTFVQRYVKSCGIDEEVTSPTFSLQTMYADKIFHYDVYNKTFDEFLSLGFLEEFEKSGVHFVEWGGDELKNLLLKLGFRVIVLKIEHKDDKREYKIEEFDA